MSTHCTITEENFDSLASCWKDHSNDLIWNTPFVLPPWMKVWWQSFAPDAAPLFLTVRQEDTVIGIAPLLVRDRVASLIGSPDVCDYMDFIVAPGKESDFFEALLADLKQRKIKLLDLRSLRPDSAAVSSLADTAQRLGYSVASRHEDLSLEVDLPATWDEYLQTLTSKQRHEVKRKLRRLEEAGNIDYRIIDKPEDVPGFIEIFLRLFIESRGDKATFMTAEMVAFFKLMTTTMAEAGLLRSSILELDSTPVAALIAFDHNDTAYLYNSAYDPQYSSLSVGVLSKALNIKDSIDRGKKRFDFLKGAEQYKYHLGGREVQLSTCQITIG